jgi:hypothetical protein
LECLESRTLLALCNVTRLGDFGAGATMGSFSRGDLRFCISHANANPGPDVINVNVTGTINLSGPLPTLATDMNIVGPGSGLLTVRRNTSGSYRIFTVGVGAQVHISGLTATSGYVSNDHGGGIHNRGTLTLVEVRIVDNDVQLTGSGDVGSYTRAFGGGIYNLGSLLIQDSTIANNSVHGADYWGDGLGGGISTSGPLTIANSTISGNYALGEDWNDNPYPIAVGGGINIEPRTIPVNIDNSTIANNTLYGYTTGGSGISLWQSASEKPSLTITHSTIAANVNGSGIIAGSNLTLRKSIVANHGSYSDVAGTIMSSGYNLIGNSTGGSGYVPSDILDVDPMLGPLADNGGLTQTMALLPGSPAIDSGTNQGAPEWDQRGPGFPRIVDGRIDIGAYEVQATGIPKPVTYLAVLSTADLDDEE